MTKGENSLFALATLLQRRLEVVGMLATSLESTRPALFRSDAEAIARGAAHQAELCRQWSRLEEQLLAEDVQRRKTAGPASSASGAEAAHPAILEQEWRALRKRLAYATRVHWSLLRHMQRSLGILQRVVNSCAPTYSPQSATGEPHISVRAGE